MYQLTGHSGSTRDVDLRELGLALFGDVVLRLGSGQEHGVVLADVSDGLAVEELSASLTPAPPTAAGL